MKTVAIVQARIGSSRLPGKVLREINGRSLIDLLLSRLSQSRLLDEIVVATGSGADNLPLVNHVRDLGYHTFQGPEDDVLARFAHAAEEFDAELVVRVTGDCPLIDFDVIDSALSLYKESRVDYVSNVMPPTFPDGLDVEVFSARLLAHANSAVKSSYEREHVTPFFRTSAFTQAALTNPANLSHLRWTVDEAVDLQVVTNVFQAFAPDVQFSWRQVLELQAASPDLFAANQYLTRNEGATLGAGQKLWKRATEVIPGGNMLLSKRSEMFLPGQWPAYFSRASGVKVWDLDNTEYTDVSLMGVGTNTLGYGHPEVDAAVRQVVDKGNLSTLNAPEEVYLAERLVAMHPFADMVRFARSGGEANAIAVRIARASSGRDKVAICGYHGWHDWYLSTNLGGDEGLAEHLLPGLDPAGVPKGLEGTVLPFRYNHFQELLDIVDSHDVGVIKMEVVRNRGPEDGFLHKVRDLATKRGIVLIFDECTSGFRESFGGLHKNYGVEPDLAVFGKTLGNGYAVTAVIGRREIMEAAQSTFISSTFWTERIGSAAALRTLEVMEEIRSWETISEIGRQVKCRWGSLAEDHGLAIDQWGLLPLAGFTFKGDRNLEYKTLITQEMLGRGFLAGNSFYASVAHSQDVIDEYFENLGSVFEMIRRCEEGLDVYELLKGPVAHAGFKRLN